jgi:hypothetical protein
MFTPPATNAIYWTAKRGMQRCQLIDSLCEYLLKFGNATNTLAPIVNNNSVQSWAEEPLTRAMLRDARFSETIHYISSASPGYKEYEIVFSPEEGEDYRPDQLRIRFRQENAHPPSLTEQVTALREQSAMEHEQLARFTGPPSPGLPLSHTQIQLARFDTLRVPLEEFIQDQPAGLRHLFLESLQRPGP